MYFINKLISSRIIKQLSWQTFRFDLQNPRFGVCRWERHLWDQWNPYCGRWAWGCEKSGSKSQHKGRLPRSGPRGSRNTLVLLWCVFQCKLAMMRDLLKRAESPSSMPRASFYRKKGTPQWHKGDGKCMRWLSLSFGTVRQMHLMRSRRALLVVAASPCCDTRPRARRVVPCRLVGC